MTKASYKEGRDWDSSAKPAVVQQEMKEVPVTSVVLEGEIVQEEMI